MPVRDIASSIATLELTIELSSVLLLKPQGCTLEWLCDLSALAEPSLGVSVFLPADREHEVACFTGGHDNTQLVAGCGEIVAGLVTKRYL